MSTTPLHDLWDASANQPFFPSVGKDAQFVVGFVLLFAALVLTGLFGLSEFSNEVKWSRSEVANQLTSPVDNNLKTLPLYGIPASLAFG